MSELVAIECFSCGVTINVTATYESNRQSDRGTFYCPNGHANRFPGEKLEDKVARLERIKADQEASIDRLLADTGKLKAQVKNLKVAAKVAATPS